MPESEPKALRGILKRLGLAYSERMEISKLSVGALTRPNFPLKVRVWAVIQIKACGYDQHLAVTQIPSAKADRHVVPLTPAAIAGELNKATLQAFLDAGIKIDDDKREALKIRKPHISRALAELEDEGVIDRFVANCQPHKLLGLTMDEAIGHGLGRRLSDLPLQARKRCPGGRVFVYVLARPRKPKHLDLDVCLDLANRRLDVTNNGNVTQSKSPEISRFFQESFDFMKNSDFRKVEAKASQVAPEKAREAGARLKKAFDEAAAEYKAAIEQLAGTEPATSTTAPAPVPTQEALFNPPPAKASASQIQNGKELHPPVNDNKASGRRDADPSLVSQPRKRFSGPDVQTVLDAMRRYASTDEGAAIFMLRACREASPSCTPVQIAEAIHAKGPLAQKRAKADREFNPVGFLITAVSRTFQGSQPEPIAPKQEGYWERRAREASNG